MGKWSVMPAEAASGDQGSGKAGSGATRATMVYDQLRSDILAGRLMPGEKLSAETLRHHFGMGGSPIREALNRLLAENFVALEDQKGFRVAPVSEDELRELVTARCWIDGTALSASIANADASWEDQLVLAFHSLRRCERHAAEIEPGGHEWESRHRAFHSALVNGCGSRWMIRISHQLFDAAERYRLLGARFVSERNELDEHRAIVDACLDRKADVAVELLETHYGRTFDVIMRHVKVAGDRVAPKNTVSILDAARRVG